MTTTPNLSKQMNAWRFFKCVDCKDLSVNLRTTHKNPGQQCKAVEVFSLEKKYLSHCTKVMMTITS